jgi:hypothetical protein
MTNIQLTVLIASRNGERVLPRVLAGYRSVVAPQVGTDGSFASLGEA